MSLCDYKYIAPQAEAEKHQRLYNVFEYQRMLHSAMKMSPTNELAETRAQAKSILAQDDVDWPAYEVAVSRILELDPSYGEPELVPPAPAPTGRPMDASTFIRIIIFLVGVIGLAMSVFMGGAPGLITLFAAMLAVGWVWDGLAWEGD